MLYYYLVKFGVNRRCLSGSYLTLNLQKSYKIVFFSTLALNSSESKWSKLLIFLLKQLYLFNNFHIKFGDHRIMLRCVFIPSKLMKNAKKKNCAYFHAYIWPSHWHRQLKFGQHIANNLSWHHVKFYGNARCLSSPYLASNLQKCSKIDVFFNLLVNISQNNRPRKLNFGGHLGDMLHYLPVKFGGNRRCLTSNVPKKTAQNGHFWACRPQILYFLTT